MTGLVAGLERKNGWTPAERAGGVGPDGMQRQLRRSDWDIDGVRDDIRGYVAERLGDRDLGASGELADSDNRGCGVDS